MEEQGLVCAVRLGKRLQQGDDLFVVVDMARQRGGPDDQAGIGRTGGGQLVDGHPEGVVVASAAVRADPLDLPEQQRATADEGEPLPQCLPVERVAHDDECAPFVLPDVDETCFVQLGHHIHRRGRGRVGQRDRPAHREQLQHSARHGVHRGEAVPDQLAEPWCGRQRSFGEGPDLPVARQRPGVQRSVHQLTQVQGVAPGRLEQAVEGAVPEGCAEYGAQQPFRPAPVEGFQVDTADRVAPRQRLHGVGVGVGGFRGRAAGAYRGDQPDRTRVEQMAQQCGGRLVQQVQVVHQDRPPVVSPGAGQQPGDLGEPGDRVRQIHTRRYQVGDRAHRCRCRGGTRGHPDPLGPCVHGPGEEFVGEP